MPPGGARRAAAGRTASRDLQLETKAALTPASPAGNVKYFWTQVGADDTPFSKKLENHMHAVSFYFMVYNFVKIHSTIKTTPAMEAGVTDFLWSMEDIVLMASTNL